MLTLVALTTTAFVPTPRVAPRASAPVMIDGSPMIDYGIATFAVSHARPPSHLSCSCRVFST